MVKSTSKAVIVQRQFAIDAPQQRVWSLLARVIYQCLPLEKMDVVNERLFYAELRWNLALIGLRFHLKVEFVDISPPYFLACILSVKRGLIQLGPRVTFALRQVNHHRTEVTCTATEENKTGKLMRWAMRRQQQSFAGKMFDSMRARLEQLC